MSTHKCRKEQEEDSDDKHKTKGLEHDSTKEEVTLIHNDVANDLVFYWVRSHLSPQDRMRLRASYNIHGSMIRRFTPAKGRCNYQLASGEAAIAIPLPSNDCRTTDSDDESFTDASSDVARYCAPVSAATIIMSTDIEEKGAI